MSCNLDDEGESTEPDKLFEEEFLPCSYNYPSCDNESDTPLDSSDNLCQPTYFHKSYSLPSSYCIGDISNIPQKSIYISPSEGKHVMRKSKLDFDEGRGVSPQMFQARLKVLGLFLTMDDALFRFFDTWVPFQKTISWFEEFDSSQKNAVLTEILVRYYFLLIIRSFCVDFRHNRLEIVCRHCPMLQLKIT